MSKRRIVAYVSDDTFHKVAIKAATKRVKISALVESLLLEWLRKRK